MVEVLDLAWVAVIVPPQISPLVTEPSAKTTYITRCFRVPLMHSNIVCKVPHLRLRAGRAWRRPPPLGRLLAPDLYMAVKFLASSVWHGNGSHRHAEWAGLS